MRGEKASGLGPTHAPLRQHRAWNQKRAFRSTPNVASLIERTIGTGRERVRADVRQIVLRTCSNDVDPVTA